jgi:hypothetical protein
MNEFDELIDKVDDLSLESQGIFLDIVSKRYSEHLREKFTQEVHESLEEYKSGHSHSGDSEELFNSLKI